MKSATQMRLVVVSDTHGGHEKLGTLEGDVLIHCGDFCNGFHREPGDVENIDAWFAKQRFDLILCVGGNHDFAAENLVKQAVPVFRHAVWLQDAAHVHLGVKFYGAPWIPDLEGWAFHVSPEGLCEKWSMIPDDTDVLITHTPPFGVLDQSFSGRDIGCRHLRRRVEAVGPRFHVFGHCHSSAGVQPGKVTTFVNASVVGAGYEVVRSAVILDLPVKTG